MLVETWQTRLENFPEFALLEKLDEQPECESRGAMQQELAHDEAHTLHVAYLVIVTRKCPQDVAHSSLTWLPPLEISVPWEGPYDI